MSKNENAAFPRPDRERENWLCLNGEWDFALFREGEEECEKKFRQNRNAYSTKIQVPFSWVSPLSGIGENVPGIGWYATNVSFNASERVFLCFGAVDYDAEIYVNGKLVFTHRGGYAQFDIDVTAEWKPGENRIEVRAEDYRRRTQTYGKQGYGDIQGIWQTVWLEARPEEYIESFRFYTKLDGEVTLQAKVAAKDGALLVTKFDGREFSGTAKDGAVTVDMRFDCPRVWSPEEPNLYEGELQLGGDVVGAYFGIREIGAAKFDGRAYKWITLNGKPVYLNATLDQAFHDKGHFTYPTDQSMKDEAWRLKRLGLNAVRIHIKSELPRKLYWMDKLGVMVIADIPCFWGEPNADAREAYENEWPKAFERDFNHPAIIQWVMFNETWGLLTKDPNAAPDAKPWESRVYLPETQEWVRGIWKSAKQADPTRIIEDNSACRYDHVQSDINTWHFYLNGYEKVREHIRNVCDGTYPGSEFNYINGNRQTDAPLMNSECGMVWGVEGSAGDSDLSWQYRYMLNEFRLQEKNCGFVFTEFHDVINEFNGYFRIDDTDKDWGYQDYCRGMTLRDLHAPDFLALDCPPCRTMGPGECAAIPMALSSFTDAHHAEGLTCEWELWHDGLDGRVSDAKGSFAIAPFGYGLTKLSDLTVRMPNENAVAVLSVYLKTRSGEVVSRNFTTFDVRVALPSTITETSPAAANATGCERVWRAHGGEKLSMAGSGVIEMELSLPKGEIHGLTLFFEASAKRFLTKDGPAEGDAENGVSFMLGRRADRGSFPNSYYMTDEDALESRAELQVEGVKVASLAFGNDYADCRGTLSFHNQPDDRKLDEAGSYGELKRVEIPSRLIPGILEKGTLKLTLCANEGGLALYGRNSGRYPIGVVLRGW